MKKMTKEQLIEYFITLLGDNHILGKFISIEEIQKRLNEKIKGVTYNPSKGDNSARWYIETGILNIDCEKDINDVDLVHELLHIITTFNNKGNINGKKVGLEIVLYPDGDKSLQKGWCYSKDYSFVTWGIALNEGITQLLAEEILGVDTNLEQGYKIEKDFSRLLFSIAEKENVLNKYFSETLVFEENAQFDYHNAMESYFGINLKDGFINYVDILEKLDEINDIVETLTVIKYNNDSNSENLKYNEKNSYSYYRSKLPERIKKLIATSLKNANGGINKKIQIINSAAEFCDFSVNIDDYYSVEELINIIFSDEIEPESQVSQKIYKFGKLAHNYDSWAENDLLKNKLEKMFIERNIICETDFTKRDMITDIIFSIFKFLEGTENDMDLKELLENFYYYQEKGMYKIIGKETEFNYLMKIVGLKNKLYEIIENNPNAKVQLKTDGEIRRITDDISILELQLMEQTSDISTGEIIREKDLIQSQLDEKMNDVYNCK